jgi:hypothetical protein
MKTTSPRIDTEILRSFIENSGLFFDENSVSWIFTCPRCSKSKKLYLRKRDGRFVCWRCKETDNFQGRAEYALSELTGQSFGDVYRFLYGDIPLRADSTFDARIEDFFGEDDEIDNEAFEHEVIKWPHDFYPIEDENFGKRGADYMRSRGVPLRLQQEYGLRYSPELRRVFFPIGERGLLYGYQGRLIVPHEYIEEESGEKKEVPKILSSKGVHRDRLLMFSDRLEGCDHAVLTEGPVDAIKAHYCRGNVATMGKEVSRHQIRLLINSGVKRVYIALDPDASESIERLVTEMNGDVELYEMIPQKLGMKTDLGAMRFEDVYELFLSAKPFHTRLFVDINFS